MFYYIKSKYLQLQLHAFCFQNKIEKQILNANSQMNQTNFAETNADS